jgi:hypothetical protein
MQPGDMVRIPEGTAARVLAVDDDLVTVQLDGDAVGRYAADQLEPIGEED